MFSCSANDPEFSDSNKSDGFPDPNKRSVAEAIRIANQCSQMNSKNLGRAGSKVVDETSVSCLTRTNGRSGTDTLIYAIDYQDDEGYVLVSANKNTEPVLAVIEKGRFEDKDTLKCGYDFFIDQAMDYVASITNPIIPEPIKPGFEDFILLYKTDTLTLQEFNPTYRLEVEWGQYWPENMFSPNKVAGSAPVATAQLFSYFEPSYNLQLNFENKPYDFLMLDWSRLKKHVSSTGYSTPNDANKLIHSLDCDADEQIHIELGCLIRCLEDSHTCVYVEDVDPYSSWTATILNSYNYASEILYDQEKIPMTPGYFYEALKDGGIGVIACNTDEYAYKHNWLADGATQIIYNITTYYNYNTRTKEYTYKEEERQVHNYIHYNWGMHGRYNGWFLDGVFDLHKGKDLGHKFKSRTDFEIRDIISAYLFK